MSKIQVTNINDQSDNAALVTQNGGIKTDKLTGKTTAGSILVTGEGNSTTTNLQQGLAKLWCNWAGSATVNNSFNTASVTDNGTGNFSINTTSAFADAPYFGDTDPTSTVFSQSNSAIENGEGAVAYCFRSIQGYSKIGSYTGNGNADGTFIHTGFKPAWVMIKRTSGAENWVIWDNKRDPINNFYHVLLANATSVEDTTNAGSGGRYVGDFLSNGFKLRNTHDTSNSSSTYVYMAFAENPFVSSKGVPTTAR